MLSLRAVAQPVGALDRFVDRAADVGRRRHLAARLARPVVGLAHDVGDAADLDRQLLPVAGQPRALLEDARDRRGIERLQAVRRRDRGHDPRIVAIVRLRAADRVVEIRLHLEQPGEVGIVLAEHVVQLPVADQHHLDVERDRLGIERLRRDQAGRLRRLLDPDLAGLDRPLQRLVGERRHQQLARIEQQIAAVGPVQRARLDQQEIGQQRAHLRDVLDPADQVGIVRVQLLHHRRVRAPSPLLTTTLIM